MIPLLIHGKKWKMIIITFGQLNRPVSQIDSAPCLSVPHHPAPLSTLPGHPAPYFSVPHQLDDSCRSFSLPWFFCWFSLLAGEPKSRMKSVFFPFFGYGSNGLRLLMSRLVFRLTGSWLFFSSVGGTVYSLGVDVHFQKWLRAFRYSHSAFLACCSPPIAKTLAMCSYPLHSTWHSSPTDVTGGSRISLCGTMLTHSNCTTQWLAPVVF